MVESRSSRTTRSLFAPCTPFQQSTRRSANQTLMNKLSLYIAILPYVSMDVNGNTGNDLKSWQERMNGQMDQVLKLQKEDDE